MRRALVAALSSAFALAAPASAHVVVSPAFVAAGAAETIELSAPNERDSPMTGLRITVPAGIEIEEAPAPEGWSSVVEGRTATWSGGSVTSGLQETFELRVAAKTTPGNVDLEAVQLYGDGGKVRWPVTLTIVPPSSVVVLESRSSSGAVALVLAGIGLLAAAAIAALAWRRRLTR